MSKYIIPKKEKCHKIGYTVKYSKGVIDEICSNPGKFNNSDFAGVINSAITIYKYSNYASYEWINYVIDSLKPYME